MTDGDRTAETSRASAVATNRVRCPCCGHPTLSERAIHQTCRLCAWEDDGQDDPHADEVWGGPNGHYSLSQGRANFRNHLNMYDTDDPMSEPYTETVTEAKRAMIAAFEAMEDDLSTDRYEELWRRVQASEQVLLMELAKMVYDNEWMHKRGERRWAYWGRIYGTAWVQKRLEQNARFRERRAAARATREHMRKPEIQ
jgi:hypothetical protein